MNFEENDKNFKITIISNVNLKLYFQQLLERQFQLQKAKVHILPCEEYNNNEGLKCISASNITVLWIAFDLIFMHYFDELFIKRKNKSDIEKDLLELFDYTASNLLKVSSGQIIWFLFEDNMIHSTYQYAMGYVILFQEMVDNINHILYSKYNSRITFVDLGKMIASIGIANAYDIKNKYRWNAVYSKGLLNEASKEIYKQFLIHQGITPKCLVLDCDNVLWGGILSEDGIDNIYLGYNGIGRIYQDFQRFILYLYYCGVILSICSKNDYSDVIKVFREHDEMILKEEYIACFEVNWNDKADNIVNISNQLNISLENIVFVDDSLFEIESVKALLPQVTAIHYDKYNIYQQLDCFNLYNNYDNNEIENRMETYRTNVSRELLKKQYSNFKDYLDALEVKVEIHRTTDLELNRVAELTQRTNRRTNGKRYTFEQIRQRYIKKNVSLYSVLVSDRFSNLGLVGCFEVEDEELSLFSLSCRALGRNIENKMLQFISANHKISQIYFADTYKNNQIIALLTEYFKDAKLMLK